MRDFTTMPASDFRFFVCELSAKLIVYDLG